MKKYAKRLTALTLALTLLAGALGQTAFASWALGSELVGRTAELTEGVSWTAQRLWSDSKSDLRTENYITYTPGSGVTPMVYIGDHVASWKTMMAAAADLESQGYRVIAGVNGGFFNYDSTVVGMLMTEGVVRALDIYNYSLLGFTWDGRVFIDDGGWTMKKSVSWETVDGSCQYNLVAFNALRSSDDLGGLYLYSQDFYSQVNYDTVRGCVAVVLSPVSDGGVTMNGTLTLSAETVMDTAAGDTFAGHLTDGRFMLYANYYDGNDALLNALRSLTPGQQVTVTVSGVSEQWADAAYGVSGLYALLRDGEIVSDLPTATNPYTVVGLKEDGTAVFYTIDGRQSGYSVGATYSQVAQRLQELGCVSAVALDGGGSTTLGATLPGRQKFELLNHPSQTGRKLNNCIFLVARDGDTGMDPGFYLSSDTQVVLAGASLNVSAAGYDRWGKGISEKAPDESQEPSDESQEPSDESQEPSDEPQEQSDEPQEQSDEPQEPSDEPQEPSDESGITPVWSATGGTVQGDGLTAVYTAGSTAGTYAVSAGSGAELPVRVVSELSRLTVTGEDGAPVGSLSLQSMDTVDLSASGQWKNLNVAMGDENVDWSVSGDIGTIDAQGRFTAGWNSASGEITASAGGRTVTIDVTVQANCPFDDVADHWSAEYVLRLYELGITNGIQQPDDTVVFHPSDDMTRGELLVFITRLLGVDTGLYQDVILPFSDVDTIPEWMLPSVKAMYALEVLNGSGSDGILYANVNNGMSREEAMTMMGRMLAEQVSQELSGFADSDSVSVWAHTYVETLVALNVVQGSGGMLAPKAHITRGEAAKLLVQIDGLAKAELAPRPFGPESGEPETQGPDGFDGPVDGPDWSGEDAGDPVFPDDSLCDLPE